MLLGKHNPDVKEKTVMLEPQLQDLAMREHYMSGNEWNQSTFQSMNLCWYALNQTKKLGSLLMPPRMALGRCCSRWTEKTRLDFYGICYKTDGWAWKKHAWVYVKFRHGLQMYEIFQAHVSSLTEQKLAYRITFLLIYIIICIYVCIYTLTCKGIWIICLYNQA